MKPTNIYLSIQRSVKIEDFRYNKIELGMNVEIEPGGTALKTTEYMYEYLNKMLNRLLNVEVASDSKNTKTLRERKLMGLEDIIHQK